MASGSSGRGNLGSKGFDFASDDILCSYEDYVNHDSANGSHSDSALNTNPSKDFHKSRMTRTSVFPTNVYNQPEDSLSQDVVSTVEKSMKKYAENIMRFLEGISSRLSQLELYCYNLDKSIGEMRSDINHDHGEADSKLKYLEKHLQEVHRSVQVLRDKQELAETQKELAKLQLVQKESSSSSHSQSTDEKASPPTSDPKKMENASETNNQQLALALPHQVAPQQQPLAPTAQASAQSMTQVTQQPPYYMTPAPLPNPSAVSQLPQNQYLPPDHQYQTSQMQDLSRVAPKPTQSQVAQTQPSQPFPQYQQHQQWPQQSPQQVQPPQQPQMRLSSTAVYPTYPPSQPANPPPQETLPNSMPMQMSYSGIPPPGSNRADSIPYGYGGTGRTVPQQLPPQQIKGNFPSQPGDVYGNTGTHPTLPPGSGYMMYDSDGGRTHHPPQPPHFTQSGYPPTSGALQNPQTGPNLMVRNPNQSQFIRNHPYNDLIEKLVNMGFRADHVSSVIQRMEESGQPIDFNSVLDRLNVHSSVSSQRGWSG
ncbi:putative Structural constituent of cell wall protein [Quillaja saponaria]|uniref:Structural constituent of cell wall protein n=1 Tax=Quillaja saponaria TaxID=32244 RepID=A0AAD7PAQ7_QUISA|nr:putative Structural constituent of cell wall protein [Quillaja saponaria]